MHGLVKCRGVSINGTKVCITRNLTLYKYEERTYKGRGMQTGMLLPIIGNQKFRI